MFNNRKISNQSSNETDDIITFILFVSYVFSVISTLFIYCFIGECFIQESTNFGKAIYDYEWYNLSATDAKLFLMCMIRTQKPQCLTSGKFAILSLTIFTDVSIIEVIFFILQLRFFIQLFSKLRWDICRYCEHLCEKKKTEMNYVVTNSYIYFLNHLPLLEDKRFVYTSLTCISVMNYINIIFRRSIKIVKTVIFFMKKINIEYERTLSDTPKFSFFKRYEELFSIL
ncbi:odorant receptor 4-like isoform X2 [Vespula maculifrons]|uniref:Odorant receptor 4-like isoform X2 n=1 Tax=Vespula maculifrons TaxID=7453 RepID=A0ABD2BPI4_VESMC